MRHLSRTEREAAGAAIVPRPLAPGRISALPPSIRVRATAKPSNWWGGYSIKYSIKEETAQGNSRFRIAGRSLPSFRRKPESRRPAAGRPFDFAPLRPSGSLRTGSGFDFTLRVTLSTSGSSVRPEPHRSGVEAGMPDHVRHDESATTWLQPNVNRREGVRSPLLYSRSVMTKFWLVCCHSIITGRRCPLVPARCRCRPRRRAPRPLRNRSRFRAA